MAGGYFIQMWEQDGKAPIDEQPFPDFEKLYDHVAAFKKSADKRILKVRLPAQATDEQRARIKALGAEPVFPE